MMRPALGLLVLALVAAFDPSPQIAYFPKTRDVAISSPDRQNYFVVDADVWAHARPDLSDLRLYAGDTQLPYALVTQQSVSASERREARILNLGSVRGATEFDLDMEGIAEYDRIDLRLSATNFVTTAEITGHEHLDEPAGTRLGTSTLYDFSCENLGSSFVLRIPVSTFRYAHVRIGDEVKPQQVTSASVASLHESKAVWMAAGACGPAQQEKANTVLSCDLKPGMPVGRILFAVPAQQVNFRRTVTISDAKGGELCRGAISRVRMQQTKPPVEAEDLAVGFCYLAATADAANPASHTIRVAIDNGDDPPLAYTSVEPQALEHRVYFDPRDNASARLYYGDALLPKPVYDYAKFFKLDADASLATLGPESANPQFAGRPDTRPWSERHKAVLWIAMLLAVAILSVIAIRGVMTSGRTQSS